MASFGAIICSMLLSPKMLRGPRCRLVGFLALLWLGGCATGSSGLWGGQLGLGPPPKVQRLANGMRLVIARDDRLRLVAVSLVVGAGSAQEPPGKAGLAHLVEHLSFVDRFESGATLHDRIRQLGATDNARTELDHTVFSAVAPRSLWRELLSVQLARLDDPLQDVDEATFRRELAVVRNEYWQKMETIGSGVGLASLQQALYATDDPYSRSVGGTPAGLAAITLADARDFAARYYRVSQVTVYVDGALSDEAVDQIAALGPPAPSPASVAVELGEEEAMVSASEDGRIVYR